MSFVQLFSLYCSFMEGNSLRHTDLVKPIREYAASIEQPAQAVASHLQKVYHPV